MSRSSELLRTTPPATLGILGICITLFLIQNVFDVDLARVTMNPRLVLYKHEFYRILSSTLFHANLMHIGMNMLSTFSISSSLEKQLGTVRLLFSILWAILISGILYISMAWTAYKIFRYDRLMYDHAVGFSGIIFHMSVLECNFHPNSSRSMFGLFSVPSFLYPWALLVVLQLLIPRLSFLGHLSGIITGTLQSSGLFEFLLPGENYTSRMESWDALRWLVNVPSFVPTPDTSRFQHREPGGISGTLRKAIAVFSKFVKGVLETFYVCIFGRGDELNSNIRLGGRPLNESGPGQVSSPVDAFEEASDDEKEPLSTLV